MNETANIAVLGAGGLGMAAAKILGRKKEMRLAAIADKTGYIIDHNGIDPELLENKELGDVGIRTDDAISCIVENCREFDGIFLALPNLTNNFIPEVVSMFARAGFKGVMVDAMKRSQAVEMIFGMDDIIKNTSITYITGAGATPGLLTCAAAIAANSFMEVTNVDINFGVGVSNWESYRATIREDIAHLEGFNLEKAANMTCAHIKNELDNRKGILQLHKMEHADDVLLERAGIVSREKVAVSGVVDTRNPRKPVSTTMTLTGKTFDGAVSSHRFILGDETTMAANVVGPALGWMKAGFEFHKRGIYGVFGSAELMPRFVK
ncbi:MAG: saccharopine dehydrogenase-like oxidoreductase [Candidatus Methanoperedens sp.]|nr:saccharopine dehydrogenase-like oxidoreductase [Candidatus Methanoperedens sp.]